MVRNYGILISRAKQCWLRFDSLTFYMTHNFYVRKITETIKVEWPQGPCL